MMKSRLALLFAALAAFCTVGFAAAPQPGQTTHAATIPGEYNFSGALSATEGLPLELLKVPASPNVLRVSQQFGSNAAAGQLEQWASTFERPRFRSFVDSPLANWTNGGSISFADRNRHNLDLPACSLTTAPDTALSYFSGILAGDAYKLWIDPAACAGCSPVYPFRVDSVKFLLLQEGGSPADTVTIAVDIECSDLSPNTPCNGPGAERCLAIYNISLPADTDAAAQVFEIALPLDSCWVDGGFFVGLWHLGHFQPDSVAYHPTVLFADSLPQAGACNVWTNLSGTWDSWANTWVDPDPGIPIVTVYGECDAPNPGTIVPCPIECAAQGSTLNPTDLSGNGTVYFYTTSAYTAMWQWFDLAPSDFPYTANGITWRFLFPAAGATTDSVQVTVTYGCPNNGNLCCVPSDILYSGSIWLHRPSAAALTSLNVDLDLSTLGWCLPSDFWVGAIITGYGGTAGGLPSFIWTDRADEVLAGNDVVACEQWLYTAGTYAPWPQGAQLGWWDVAITGVCGSCSGTPGTCSPASTLNCGTATPLACGPSPQVLNGQTTVGGTTTASMYCCAPWLESGPEKIYSVTVPANGSINAAVSNTGGQDLDIFVLSACDPQATLACSDSALTLSALAAGTYYIVVDGFDGAEGTFTLTYTIPCAGATACPNTLCGTGLNGAAGDSLLTWDGERLPNGNAAFLQQTTGSSGEIANDMKVKILDASCNLVSTVDLGGSDATRVGRGLAHDDRDGSWWTCTFVAPKLLRHYSSTGTLIAEFDSAFFAGQHMTGVAFSGTGLAFDADNNHLWMTIGRRVAGQDTSFMFEFDVNNAAAPTIRQIVLARIHAGANYSTGGLDYDECTDRLHRAIFRSVGGTGLGELECWLDVNPSGIGGGLLMQNFCTVPAGGVEVNWGLSRGAATDQLLLPNLDAVVAPIYTDQRVFTTTSSCLSSPPAVPQQVRCNRAGADIQVYFDAPTPGRYVIWKTTIRNNSFPADYSQEATVTVTAGTNRLYTDVGAFAPDAYLNYVVTQACP